MLRRVSRPLSENWVEGRPIAYAGQAWKPAAFTGEADPVSGHDPDLWSTGSGRRHAKALSAAVGEVGRLPSLLGREFSGPGCVLSRRDF